MNTETHRLGNFEERLLGELQSIVAAQPAAAVRPRGARLSRRRVALAAGVAAALAIAAGAGVPLLSGGAEPAYAVTPNADGTVTVEIASLGDAAGLQTKLRAAGIPAVVQYLPAGKTCKQPWFTPATPQESAAGAGTTVRGGVQHTSDGRTRFTISENLPADETLVIMTQTPAGPAADGPTSIGIALAKGEVGPCEVVDAPAGSPAPGAPPAGGILHTSGPETGAGPSTSLSGSK